MPINIDLNVDPYFDDFDLTKQFYRVLFKPSYAVQARELTQMQTILQNQIEQFGDNIFKEGSIVKGCTFTDLNNLRYVKVTDKDGFDVATYVGFTDTVTIGAEEFDRDNTYELRGDSSGVRARIIAATRGFETRNPDLNTFYINYINTSGGGNKVFQSGELLRIFKISVVQANNTTNITEEEVDTINVTTFANSTGRSFGLRSAPGIIFQKGHFLYTEEQLVILSKYDNRPNNVSVGFTVEERIINAFQDASLYDNANGSNNQNAPGADRLKLVPVLVAMPTDEADVDTTFFTLARYSDGNAVTLRDVSQYNVLGEEMARRTYEESGDYIVKDLKTKVIRRNGNLQASIGTGLAYVKGYRVENLAEQFVNIDSIAETSVGERINQPVSYNYGGYLNVLESATSGVVPIDGSTVNLRNESDVVIGTARVRNFTDDKIFLYDIRFSGSNKLSSVTTIAGSSGFLTVANNTIIPTINEAFSSSMIFDTGAISLKSIENLSLPIREVRNLSGLSGNTITITAGIDEDFSVNNDDIVFVDATNLKINVLSTDVANNNLIVTLSEEPSATGTIYFNKRISNATPFTKTSVELYVISSFANTDSQSSTKFNLGFPDVYEIVSITDADGNDVTGSFKLRTNQKDNYYDHSYIEFIPGRIAPVVGDMTIRMNAFKLNDTSGQYFFNVNSYPSSVAKNKIQPFVSSSGRTFVLRDCIDFRPLVLPISGASYVNAASILTAPTVSDSSTGVNLAPSFDPSYDILTPTLNEFSELDYEFYYNRTDAITLDSYGRISIIRGTESDVSVAPNVTGDQIRIADIYVPGIPALTPEEAYAQDRPQYSVKVVQRGTKSYKMKDIENLEKKVDSLRYYVLLTALEAETKNLNILDENGLDRFKNGIIVDPFNDLNIANLSSADFSAALDFTEKSLMPSVKTYPIKMKYKSNSNSTIFPTTNNPQVATLGRNQDVSIISQPYATGFRNCASNFYSYKGNGSIDPEYDALYDVTTNPVSLDIDLVTPLTALVDSIQSVIPQVATSSQLLTQWTTVATEAVGNQIITTQAATVRETFNALSISGENVSEVPVGDFVSNVNFNPFIAPREVNIYMSGLRPNTRHYFFFDQVDVNEFIAPGDDVDTAREVHRNGNFGDPVFTDENGVLTAVFAIPRETFFVGDRTLDISDVDIYSSIRSGSTSNGSVTYRAYNFSVERSSLTASTRAPNISVEQTVSDRTVTNRIVETIQVDFGGGGDDGDPRPDPPGERGVDWDPIAQTFFIKSGMGLGSNTVFVSKLDLFFKRKSDTNGVIVEIREVINGYPSYQNVPFSRVHLTPNQIVTSDNASLATVVSFPAPVRLDTEKEYAFVVIPDAADPNYLIFTSQVGLVDLTPGATQGLPIVQDWGDGVLFTSTNNRAWQSYQDEDIKFTLYRHNFNSNVGSVTLSNDDQEFLTTTNNIGRFKPGEVVYKIFESDPATSNTVSVVTGNNQITGTELSVTYSNDDYILLDNGTNKQLFKVLSANSTVITADRPASFTASLTGSPVVIGNLSHYDFKYPDFIILDKSSANETRKFEENDTIYGFDSNAEATISSVDNMQFSYIQPMILRTNDSVTSTTLSGTFVDPNNTTNTYDLPMLFNDRTTFDRYGMVVFSKSNDIARTKTLDLTVNMNNRSNVTSTPFIDIDTAVVLAYRWNITNTSSTTAKYISKTVELVENLDAEDFQVFVTGYRPRGTDIKVYIRPQSANDPSIFEDINWIELELTNGINLYSSISNRFDFKEYVYKVPETAKDGGVLTYTNDIGSFVGYRRFAIKIELLSESIFKAPRLLDYRGIALT